MDFAHCYMDFTGSTNFETISVNLLKKIQAQYSQWYLFWLDLLLKFQQSHFICGLPDVLEGARHQ